MSQATSKTSVESNSYEEIRSERFSDKIVVITGASDRGIGGAIAERFAREGAGIALFSPDRPQRLTKMLERIDCEFRWCDCDVTKSKEVADAIDETMSELSQIDILVNNAGIEIARPFEEFKEDDWRHVLDVNLNGVIEVTQATLKFLPEPGGVIVNVSSALSLAGCPGFSIYSASKAGLNGLTQSLAWELAPRGVRVVGVAPGLVHTPMIHKHIEHLTPEVMQRIEACHPLGIGMPHDVAGAVAFLASNDASWITGVTLPLGWSNGFPLPTGAFMSG